VTEKRGRGRPRREGADEEILAVARELLRERGYGAFTVDTIAEHTGIAKTTIYRRWPSKGALVAAAIAPAGGTSGDAEELVRDTAAIFAQLGAIDGEAIDLLRAILAPRREQLRALVGDQRADELLGALVVRVLSAES
jgi:AcrR family transcriptional regulator